jgi:hypothetical protein
MLVTMFHDRVSLAILGGVTFGLALATAFSQVESPCGPIRDEPVTLYVPAPSPPTLDCTASIDNARRCAHALHMSRQTKAAAQVLWSVIHPCCHSGPAFRVNKGVKSKFPWHDAYAVRDLAFRYERFAGELDALEVADPEEAYWPLPGLRTLDLELGGAYAVEIDRRLREMAPRAANLYAKRGDCIAYREPAAIAKELGVPAARCRRVRR